MPHHYIPTDKELFEALARGKTVEEIARELRKEKGTLQTHLWRLRGRMGANTNEHAIGLMYTTMAFDSRGYVLTRDQREARVYGASAGGAVNSPPIRYREAAE